MSRAPIFILGYPRSGTSLLRLMLSAHPNVVVAPESSFMSWLAPEFATWQASDNDTERVSEFVAALVSAKKFDMWGLSQEALSGAINERQPESYADLAAIPYLLFAQKMNKPDARWGDKNNVHLDYADYLASLYPDAYFLHILRDPRDCYVSLLEIQDGVPLSKNRPPLSANPIEFAANWQSRNISAQTQLKDLPSRRYMKLRFEDLTTEPERLLRDVCDFLEEAWSDDLLSYYEGDAALKMEGAELMQWKKLLLQPVDPARNGRYADSLADTTSAMIAQTATTALKLFGYQEK